MAVIRLRFAPPTDDDVVALLIYEALAIGGPYGLIERTTDIGSWPEYVDNWETIAASSINDWFAIAWEDDSGGVTALSEPIQGIKTTVISNLVDRVMLRDPSLDENVVIQSAEFVVNQILLADDPYAATTATTKQIEAMTLLTMARSYLYEFVKRQMAGQWTAGLVSVKSMNAGDFKNSIQALIDEANLILGLALGGARVGHVEMLQIAGGLAFSELAFLDISRLEVIEIE